MLVVTNSETFWIIFLSADRVLAAPPGADITGELHQKLWLCPLVAGGSSAQPVFSDGFGSAVPLFPCDLDSEQCCCECADGRDVAVNGDGSRVVSLSDDGKVVKAVSVVRDNGDVEEILLEELSVFQVGSMFPVTRPIVGTQNV